MSHTESVADEIARLRAENAALKLRTLARGKTPGEALAFEHNRPGYKIQPTTLLGERLPECGCEFYNAVFTLHRWNALGFGVKKGEHPVHRSGKREQFPLFCSCQVYSPFGYDLPGQRLDYSPDELMTDIPF